MFLFLSRSVVECERLKSADESDSPTPGDIPSSPCDSFPIECPSTASMSVENDPASFFTFKPPDCLRAGNATCEQLDPEVKDCDAQATPSYATEISSSSSVQTPLGSKTDMFSIKYDEDNCDSSKHATIQARSPDDAGSCAGVLPTSKTAGCHKNEIAFVLGERSVGNEEETASLSPDDSQLKKIVEMNLDGNNDRQPFFNDEDTNPDVNVLTVSATAICSPANEIDGMQAESSSFINCDGNPSGSLSSAGFQVIVGNETTELRLSSVANGCSTESNIDPPLIVPTTEINLNCSNSTSISSQELCSPSHEADDDKVEAEHEWNEMKTGTTMHSRQTKTSEEQSENSTPLLANEQCLRCPVDENHTNPKSRVDAIAVDSDTVLNSPRDTGTTCKEESCVSSLARETDAARADIFLAAANSTSPLCSSADSIDINEMETPPVEESIESTEDSNNRRCGDSVLVEMHEGCTNNCDLQTSENSIVSLKIEHSDSSTAKDSKIESKDVLKDDKDVCNGEDIKGIENEQLTDAQTINITAAIEKGSEKMESKKEDLCIPPLVMQETTPNTDLCVIRDNAQAPFSPVAVSKEDVSMVCCGNDKTSSSATEMPQTSTDNETVLCSQSSMTFTFGQEDLGITESENANAQGKDDTYVYSEDNARNTQDTDEPIDEKTPNIASDNQTELTHMQNDSGDATNECNGSIKDTPTASSTESIEIELDGQKSLQLRQQVENLSDQLLRAQAQVESLLVEKQKWLADSRSPLSQSMVSSEKAALVVKFAQASDILQDMLYPILELLQSFCCDFVI